MTKSNATKRALITSIVSLFICFTMLLGTTYAWFTDEVVSTGNKIQSGKLAIDMLVKDAQGEYQSVKESKAPIFNYDLWEPGYTEAVNVKVANLGTLALQYSMQIVTEGLVEAVLNNDIMLSDAIDVYYAAEEITVDSRDAFEAAVANRSLKYMGVLTDVLFGGSMVNDTLLEGEEDYATIVLKMKETAGNEYQDLSVGTKFDLKIFATQLAAETDAFDNQYDNISLPSATVMAFDKDYLEVRELDAGCAYISNEASDSSTWDYDEVNNVPAEGTPAYAYYFADYVVSFSQSHAADEVGLWGYYESWGVEESFTMGAIEAGKEYRVIEIAGDKLGIDMGSISYRQLVEDVKTFACGVTEGSLNGGETITVSLRLYETKLDGNHFVETGTYFDVAVYYFTNN